MRKSGVLMHITSLPTQGGFGTMGQDAYAFVDWLKKAGMSLWQVLPIGPTGYGESPYQSPSTHAGNMYMIDLTLLIRDGILNADAEKFHSGAYTSFEDAKARKRFALKMSFDQSFDRMELMVDAFTQAHADIDDYALFMALKDYFGGKPWLKWPDVAIRMREESAMNHYRRILRDEINFYRFTQYLFHAQWMALKAYANKNGIQILGDMPIYVAEDSADAWANPEIFQFDRERRPVKVAGVPPDYFSEDGQLWGNPLYDWKALKKSGYAWWLKRLKTADERFDIVRVDHFIGFANYYAIRAGAPNARVGKWEKAPGRSFFFTVKRKMPEIDIVAENLGVISSRVKRLLRFTGYPGMKVLQFGFDSDAQNPHFPLNITENTVVYTGTHDNDTALGWWSKASEKTRAFASENLPARDAVKPQDANALPERETIADRMIEAALGSAARIAIIPAQDILRLGSEARMNTPGTVGNGNWMWRMTPGALTDEMAAKMRELNEFYERIPS